MKRKLDVRNILKKRNSGEQLFKYEEEYLFDKLRSQADEACNSYIRLRDMGKGCVSYGANACRNRVENACHWIEAGWYSHRRSEDNIHGGCSICNGYNKREHQMYYDMWIVNKYGKDRANEQLTSKHKRKPDIDTLLDIIEYYKSKYLVLKNESKSV